nr:lysine-specific demethylase JMJ706-like isoform X1 [Tanacetum cinerariifolium]
MFTQEEQYTELLELIPESHQVPQNDNNVISEVTSVEQGEKIVEQHPVNFEETRDLYDSLYQNLAIEVEKVNSNLSRLTCPVEETLNSLDDSDSEVFRVKRRSSVKPQHRKATNSVPSKSEHQGLKRLKKVQPERSGHSSPPDSGSTSVSIKYKQMRNEEAMSIYGSYKFGKRARERPPLETCSKRLKVKEESKSAIFSYGSSSNNVRRNIFFVQASNWGRLALVVPLHFRNDTSDVIMWISLA